MPRDDESHAARVDAWVADRIADLSAGGRRRLFEQALTALWRRAGRTLGEVTLGAILDRVLYTAIEQYPLLATLELQGDGLRWAGAPPTDDLALKADLEAGRFVLVELLTVLGILTGDILTPALHAELASVGVTEIRDGEGVTS
jgi:hypothetical protein